jgi:hypothetical protein
VINISCKEHVNYQAQTRASVPTLHVALAQTKASMSNSRTNPRSRRMMPMKVFDNRMSFNAKAKGYHSSSASRRASVQMWA